MELVSGIELRMTVRHFMMFLLCKVVGLCQARVVIGNVTANLIQLCLGFLRVVLCSSVPVDTTYLSKFYYSSF